MGCKICNEPLKNDLFAMVTKESVCCVCKVKYIGGLPTTNSRVAAARKGLGLEDGAYIAHDRADECRKILGR